MCSSLDVWTTVGHPGVGVNRAAPIAGMESCRPQTLDSNRGLTSLFLTSRLPCRDVWSSRRPAAAVPARRRALRHAHVDVGERGQLRIGEHRRGRRPLGGRRCRLPKRTGMPPFRVDHDPVVLGELDRRRSAAAGAPGAAPARSACCEAVAGRAAGRSGSSDRRASAARPSAPRRRSAPSRRRPPAPPVAGPDDQRRWALVDRDRHPVREPGVDARPRRPSGRPPPRARARSARTCSVVIFSASLGRARQRSARVRRWSTPATPTLSTATSDESRSQKNSRPAAEHTSQDQARAPRAGAAATRRGRGGGRPSAAGRAGFARRVLGGRPLAARRAAVAFGFGCGFAPLPRRLAPPSASCRRLRFTLPVLELPALRPLDLAEHLHLGLELDPEPLVDPPPALGHQREHVGGGRLADVLDEVRVLVREAGAADLEPAAAGASSSWPAVRPSARGSSGFLKVEPKVLIPDGWASRRCPRISARVALTAAGSASASPNDGARDHLARPAGPSGGTRSRARSGSRRSTPAAVQTSTHSSTRAELAAVGVGVHPHGAADRARDVDAELEPGEAPAGGLRGGRRQPGPAAADHPVASRSIVVSSPPSLMTSPPTPSSATSRLEPEPTTSTSRPSAAAQASSSTNSSLALGPGEAVGAAAGPHGRQPRERVVALDSRRARARSSPARLATSASASRKMSPAPIVTSRSPSPSRPSRARARAPWRRAATTPAARRRGRRRRGRRRAR